MGVILGMHVGWAQHAWMGCCTLEFNLFLHAQIHELEGTLSVMVLHAVSCAPLLIRVWCVGLDFVEEQRDRCGRVLGKSLLFAQQLSGRVHVGTWAGGNKSLNLRISQEKEIMARCAVSGSSSSDSFCHSCATWARQCN